MFLLRSMSEHEDNWMQAGIKNKLALFALLDEFIQRDEAFRKIKSRNYALDKRQELDRKLLEARTERIEKEKHKNAINQSLRILELEKRKRESIEAANRRFHKMKIDTKERDAFHEKRLQAIQKDSHKRQERERTMLHEREQFIETEKSKMNNVRQFNKLQENKCRAEIDLLRQRVIEIENQKAKARAEAKQKIQFMDKIQRQKTEYHVKRLRDLERNHEKEDFSLVSRINDLEMEKDKQKNILRKRNEQFKKVLENREKMTSLQRQNGEKRKQKYFSKLNSRITKLGKQRDNLIYNSKENLSVLREKAEKEKKYISRRGYISESEKRRVDDKTWKGIDEMSKKKERETTKNVIDALQNARKKNDLYPIKETISESDETGKELSRSEATEGEADDMQKERLKKWDLDAKAREQQRIKDAFRKLMGSFRK